MSKRIVAALAALMAASMAMSEPLVINEELMPEFEKVCDEGLSQVCFATGMLYRYGSDKNSPEYKLIQSVIQKTAKKMGYDGFQIRLKKKSLPLALRYFSKACDLGDKDGCTYAGTTAHKQGKSAKNKKQQETMYQQAIIYLTKACQLGDSNTCEALKRNGFQQ